MSSLLDWIQQAVLNPTPFQRQMAATAAVLAIFLLLRWAVLRALYRRFDDARLLYQWRKTVTYITALLTFLAVGRIWFQGFGSISTFLGLLTAGLAIALQDPIVNLAGWLFLVWRRPFNVGDRIQIGEHRGDVIDVRIFQFTIMEIGNWVEADQSTGRIIHIPNGKIFREAQANYTQAFHYIWNEIPVLVTFESNWRKAKEILSRVASDKALHLSAEAQEQIRRAARQFMIFYTHLTPIVYTSVADSGVLLTIRYMCEPTRRRTSAEDIWEALLTEFALHDDIDFAYPTTRFYGNAVEGKPGARADLLPEPPAAIDPDALPGRRPTRTAPR